MEINEFYYPLDFDEARREQELRDTREHMRRWMGFAEDQYQQESPTSPPSQISSLGTVGALTAPNRSNESDSARSILPKKKEGIGPASGFDNASVRLLDKIGDASVHGYFFVRKSMYVSPSVKQKISSDHKLLEKLEKIVKTAYEVGSLREAARVEMDDILNEIGNAPAKIAEYAGWWGAGYREFWPGDLEDAVKKFIAEATLISATELPEGR